MSSHKHLNAHDRIIIENGLNQGESFKSIAKKLNKDCTTISKEVKKNHVERNVCGPGRCFNSCIDRSTYQLSGVCTSCSNPKRNCCKFYRLCRNECDQFIEELCPRLLKAPYVCNAYPDKNKCTLTKKLYYALETNKPYQRRLSESRQDLNIDKADISRLDNLLTPLAVQQEQSIHHIYINHSDEIMMSEKKSYQINLNFYIF